MRKEDIQVGARYVNSFNTKFTYLGIGKRVMWNGTYDNNAAEFTDKNLIVIDGAPAQIGQIVQNPEDCFDEFWDSFEKVD